MLVWSGIQGFGIWNLAPGIHNPLNKWNQETSTQNVVKKLQVFIIFFSCGKTGLQKVYRGDIYQKQDF